MAITTNPPYAFGDLIHLDMKISSGHSCPSPRAFLRLTYMDMDTPLIQINSLLQTAYPNLPSCFCVYQPAFESLHTL